MDVNYGDMHIKEDHIDDTLAFGEEKIRLKLCEQEFGYTPRHVQFGYFHRFYFEDEADMMAYILWRI